jgi:hypothetical protein
MNRLLFLVFFFPLALFGQADKFPTKAQLERAYDEAISNFIKEASNRNGTRFDTLYIGKRKNGQPDDFPDIELRPRIELTEIKLVSPELGKKLMNERKSRTYINLMGWVSKEKTEFIFVVFSNGFQHQYDYQLTYAYKKGRFELTDLKIQKPPFKK